MFKELPPLREKNKKAVVTNKFTRKEEEGIFKLATDVIKDRYRKMKETASDLWSKAVSYLAPEKMPVQVKVGQKRTASQVLLDPSSESDMQPPRKESRVLPRFKLAL